LLSVPNKLQLDITVKKNTKKNPNFISFPTYNCVF
jgi:hypothetical protein